MLIQMPVNDLCFCQGSCVLISEPGVGAMYAKAYCNAKGGKNGRHQKLSDCNSLCMPVTSPPELSGKNFTGIRDHSQQNGGYSFVTLTTHFASLRFDSVASITRF